MQIKEDITIIPFAGKTPKIHSSVFCASGSRIIGDVIIEENSSIWFNVVIRGDVNYIRIGKSTNIQDNSVIHVTDQGLPTIIGNEVTIGHMVMLHACTIKDGSLIGMGSTILDGAIIGENCLVGANSLVTQNKTFPPGSLIMGAPAQLKRQLTSEELKELKQSAPHYVDIMKKYKL